MGDRDVTQGRSRGREVFLEEMTVQIRAGDREWLSYLRTKLGTTCWRRSEVRWGAEIYFKWSTALPVKDGNNTECFDEQTRYKWKSAELYLEVKLDLIIRTWLKVIHRKRIHLKVWLLTIFHNTTGSSKSIKLYLIFPSKQHAEVLTRWCPWHQSYVREG